jgi:hypothetical protein
MLRDLADSWGSGPFRRVWFLGEEACEVVAERKVSKIAMVTMSISAEAYRAITGAIRSPQSGTAAAVIR